MIEGLKMRDQEIREEKLNLRDISKAKFILLELNWLKVRVGSKGLQIRLGLFKLFMFQRKEFLQNWPWPTPRSPLSPWNILPENSVFICLGLYVFAEIIGESAGV